MKNNIQTGIRELYNCSEAFLDEFEDDYGVDIHSNDLIGSYLDGSGPNDAFENRSKSCNDLDGYKSRDDSGDKLDDDVFEEKASIKYKIK